MYYPIAILDICIPLLFITARRRNSLIYLGITTLLVLYSHSSILSLTRVTTSLYIDRFYSSPELALALLSQGITVTGTVLQNRQNMPVAVRGKQKSGDMDAYKKNKMVVIRWTDKRTLS